MTTAIDCLCCCRSHKEDALAGSDEDETFEESELEETSNSLRAVGRDCYSLAGDTIDLCTKTVEKSGKVVDFGEEIKSTLTGFGADMDSSAIDTIKDLIDGDHAREAKSLAGDMSSLTKECLSKSVQLFDRMQDGVDNLPRLMKRVVNRRAKKVELTTEERALGEIDVSSDEEELENCVQAINDLKLVTALDAGKRAYSGIADKTVVCRTIIEAIKKFAHAVMTIAEAFRNLEVKAVISKIKDIWRCIRLSGLMKELAEAAGRVIRLVIRLFDGAAGKLSELWAALKKAKDCLVESVRPAREVREICSEVSDRGIMLQEKTEVVSVKTRGIGGDEPGKFLSNLKSLGMAKDIKEAIGIARNMDDLVTNCTDKVGSMVDRVRETYEELPDIVTDGIPEMIEAGASDDDPELPSVDEDLEELERTRAEVEGSNLLSAAKATREGFSSISGKISTSRDLVQSFQGFAEIISKTIDSFLGVWNLELARDKIVDICRLVTLGNLMKRFAAQIKRLLQAIMELLRSMVDRLDNLIPDKLENAFDAVSDFADNLNIFKR